MAGASSRRRSLNFHLLPGRGRLGRARLLLETRASRVALLSLHLLLVHGLHAGGCMACLLRDEWACVCLTERGPTGRDPFFSTLLLLLSSEFRAHKVEPALILTTYSGSSRTVLTGRRPVRRRRRFKSRVATLSSSRPTSFASSPPSQAHRIASHRAKREDAELS